MPIEEAEIIEQQTEVFNLEEELKVPTEVKTFDFNQPAADAGETIAEETAGAFDDEIDTEKLRETVSDTVADNFEATYDSSTLAPAIVDGLDAVLQQVLPILYERSSFTDDERKIIKVLAYKQRKGKETTLNEKELELMSACAEYEAYVDGLPLTANEKKQLIKPLSEMLKDVNLATTPQNALIIAALMIAIPRILPIGINKFVKNKNNEE